MKEQRTLRVHILNIANSSRMEAVMGVYERKKLIGMEKWFTNSKIKQKQKVFLNAKFQILRYLQNNKTKNAIKPLVTITAKQKMYFFKAF